MTDIEHLMTRSPVMAIFRNMPADEAVALANRAWSVGIELVEVPIQSPDALPALQAVIAAGRERDKPVGSGTVTTIEQLEASANAGAAFTVAPGFDEQIVAASARMELPHLPGVATPTEIQRAVAAGCVWLKAFPASVLGAGWFAAMRGPFPGVSLVATGGIDASNAQDFLNAGAKTVAVGSALADTNQLDRLSDLIRERGRD